MRNVARDLANVAATDFLAPLALPRVLFYIVGLGLLSIYWWLRTLQFYLAVGAAARIVSFRCSVVNGVPTLEDNPVFMASSAVDYLAITPNGEVSIQEPISIPGLNNSN